MRREGGGTKTEGSKTHRFETFLILQTARLPQGFLPLERRDTCTIHMTAITRSTAGMTLNDEGADPNQLVAVTDNVAATSLPAESFTVLETAAYGDVLRGVNFIPGVAITNGGFVRDRRTGFYVQQVTIQNETSAVLRGPINLALDKLSANATLANKTGNVGSTSKRADGRVAECVSPNRRCHRSRNAGQLSGGQAEASGTPERARSFRSGVNAGRLVPESLYVLRI